jgi:2-isopropylmalate synthase
MKDYENEFSINSYFEHSRGDKSSAEAVAYIQIEAKEVNSRFGVGVDNDIATASIKAMFCALNRTF